LHCIFVSPAPQLTEFGVQVPCGPPSGGVGAQHALVLVMHPPASPPQGTNPGLLGAPPSGILLAEPLSAASMWPPSPAFPASAAPLLLLDELEPLLLPLLLDELPPLLLLLLLLDELEPLPELPKPLLLPPLPLLPDVVAGLPASGVLPELLHSENTNDAPTAIVSPSIHSPIGFIAVLLDAISELWSVLDAGMLSDECP
jgi:hypothetical protein